MKTTSPFRWLCQDHRIFGGLIILLMAGSSALLAQADAIRDVLRQGKGRAAVVFTEARENPIRHGRWPSADALAQRQIADAAFAGSARPGEFFVFQICVHALNKSGPLSVTFQDLVGEGETIPASALACLSLGGVDHLGRSFTKEVMVEAGGLQPLWVGVAVPLTASGTFKGTIEVGVAPGESVSVPLTLCVSGAPLADQGDSTAANLSRLRWLNSTVGSEPTLTHPFTAVQIAGRRIRVLGRELELGPNGLPARIRSTFSPANTYLQETRREVLARPTAFVVETLGQPVRWEHTFESLTCTELEATWNVSSSSEDLARDLHTWNHFNSWAGWANNLTIYMEILPYLDRLWLGEGFDANAADPDFWLVEMSGLPFGIMSEMLDGANPWRGMLFGETARLPWSGDPRGLWAVWDEYGIQGTEFLPFTLEDLPVRTDHPQVLTSVYRRQGRSFVALGSWASETTSVNLTVDWEALGLDPAHATILAPAIPGMQPEQRWQPGEALKVEPGRGWFLVLGSGLAQGGP